LVKPHHFYIRQIPFLILESEKGIRAICLNRSKKSCCRGREAQKLKKEIKEYLSGKRKTFSHYALNFNSMSLFGRKVLKETLKISYGKTATYSEIAKRVKSPASARAVGNALNKNPYPILIPCHRIVAKDGKGGGFSCGKRIKRRLLELESV